jgi:hypothetical protein
MSEPPSGRSRAVRHVIWLLVSAQAERQAGREGRGAAWYHRPRSRAASDGTRARGTRHTRWRAARTQ